MEVFGFFISLKWVFMVLVVIIVSAGLWQSFQPDDIEKFTENDDDICD